MVLGDTNRTSVAQSHGQTMKPFMEERTRETGACVETSNGIMIAEILVPRLFKIADESGEMSVSTGSGSLDMKPSSSPILLEMMEVANGTRCAEQILSYGEVEKVLIGGVLTMLTLITICGNLLVVILRVFCEKATAALQLSDRVPRARGPLRCARGDAVRQHHGPDRWPMDFWQVLL